MIAQVQYMCWYGLWGERSSGFNASVKNSCMLTSSCPFDWVFEPQWRCPSTYHNRSLRLICGVRYFLPPKIACLNKSCDLLKFRFSLGLDLAHIHLYSLGKKAGVPRDFRFYLLSNYALGRTSSVLQSCDISTERQRQAIEIINSSQ